MLAEYLYHIPGIGAVDDMARNKRVTVLVNGEYVRVPVLHVMMTPPCLHVHQQPVTPGPALWGGHCVPPQVYGRVKAEVYLIV